MPETMGGINQNKIKRHRFSVSFQQVCVQVCLPKGACLTYLINLLHERQAS